MGVREEPLVPGSATPASVPLTGVGGKYHISDDLRKLLCLTSDGVLYVSGAHLVDSNVRAFMERLARDRVGFRVQKVPVEEIQAHYQASAALKGLSRGARGQPAARVLTNLQDDIEKFLKRAGALFASDIRFIIDRGVCRVKVRVHGDWRDFGSSFTEEEGWEFCQSIYNTMCDQSSSFFQKEKSQDARVSGKFIDKYGLNSARVATRPLDLGMLLVIRLFYRTLHPTLESLGYTKEQLETLRALVRRLDGMILFSGRTGSGKSTSMALALGELAAEYKEALNIITIEHPCEAEIRGVHHTPLDADFDDDVAVSKAWARAIANCMRLAPDVLMVGEIRDLASAVAAFRAAMTGHGLLSTVHANDADGAMVRLEELGVERGLLTDHLLLTGLVNQTLVKTICKQCPPVPYLGNEDHLSPALRRRVEKYCDPTKVFLRSPAGCSHCHFTGVAGRTVIAEVIETDERFMDLYRAHGRFAARAYWVSECGGLTKNQHLIQKINAGLIDPRDGERGCTLDRDVKLAHGVQIDRA